VEVQKGARLQIEHSWALFAKHRARAQLLEKRRYSGESGRTRVLHGCRNGSALSGQQQRWLDPIQPTEYAAWKQKRSIHPTTQGLFSLEAAPDAFE
jgi:hypothetical protein